MSSRPDHEQSPEEQTEEPRADQVGAHSPPSRWSVFFWWVLASAVGGAAGAPISEPLEILGYLVLPGAILGGAQALVLGRYLRSPGRSASHVRVMWVVASFSGWFAGWLVSILAGALANLTGVPEISRQIGSAIALLVGTEAARTTFLSYSLVWAVLAASQGVALALMAIVDGRRSLLPLAVLWMPAGAVGGALAVATGFALNARVFPDGGNLLERIVFLAAGQAAGWALYGAATGLVLVAMTRRVARETRSPSRLRGWSPAAAGLATLLALSIFGAFGFGKLLGQDCSDEERAIYEEFPQYGGWIEPGTNPATGACFVRYEETQSTKEEVQTYYSERLRENGWRVTREPSADELASPDVTTRLKTVPDEPGETTEVQYTRVRELIRAERDGYRYKVSYHSSEARKEAPRSGGEIVVHVGEGRF